jgi:hypothetical protein
LKPFEFTFLIELNFIMKVLKVFILVLLLKTTTGWAQQMSPISAGVDVGSGIGSNSWAPSILYHEEIGSK